MYSLLENVDEKINLYVLHNEPNTFEKYSKKLSKHSKCESINLIEVVTDINFPNIENTHVSKATYFRIFIFKYLKDLSHVIYLDSDTVILENPLKVLKSELAKLRESQYILSAVEETTKEMSPEIFERLNLSSKKYFNAGVMVIDLDKAKNKNIFNNLISTVQKLNSRIIQWDQDVLNKYFDEQIFELAKSLNIRINAELESKVFSLSPTILHYLGSKKPWQIEYLVEHPNNHFQVTYQQFTKSSNYYLTSNWKKNTLVVYLKQMINFKKFISKKNYKLLRPVFYLFVKRKD